MRRLLIAATAVVAAFAAALGPAMPAAAAPPANDDFAAAQQIAGSEDELAVSFEEATSDPDDPPETGGDPSLWFRWTAPSTAWYRFSLPDVDEDCRGVAAVYQGDSLDALTARSHEASLDDEWRSNAAFVRAREGQTYAIVAASTCDYYAPLTFAWEQRGPLIVTVRGPDAARQPGVGVMEVSCSSADNCWPVYWYNVTNALGDAYFNVADGQYDSTVRFELRPRSVNLASRYATVRLPPGPTSRAITAPRVLYAKPSVDLDRDGIGDMVSGVPLANRGAADAGAVVVQYGDGGRRVLDEASTGVPSSRLRSEQFGASVVADDVDRDGWPDLTIGAPGEMVGSVRSGAVFIVFGSARGLGNGRRSLRLHQGLAGVAGGARRGDRFGAAVAPVRTYVYTHFVVGAPGKDSGGKANAGAVVRFTKFPVRDVKIPPSQVWHQGTSGVGGKNVAGDRFGSALAHGGFGSRNPSLAIGVPGKDARGARNAGAVVVLRAANAQRNYAPSGNPLINQNTAAVVPGSGTKPGNAFGSALVAFPEGTPLAAGYGRDRLAIGAPGEGGGTVTVLTSGNRQPLVFAPVAENTRVVQGADDVPGGDETGDRFGAALATGDVNDDGEHDLVVGSPGEEVSGRAAAGAVTVVYGARDADRSSRWVADGGAGVRPGTSGVPGGPSTGSRFGLSVASLDSNGDGHPEVIGGSPGDDTVARNAGAVYLAYGSRSGLEGGRRVTWPQVRANDGFGARLAVPQMFSADS